MNELSSCPVLFDCQVFIVSGFIEINPRKDSLFSEVMLVPYPSLSDSQLYLRPLNPSNRVILSELDLGLEQLVVTCLIDVNFMYQSYSSFLRS